MSVSLHAIDPLAYLVEQVNHGPDTNALGVQIESIYSGNAPPRHNAVGRRRDSSLSSSEVPRVIENAGDVITGVNTMPRKKIKFRLLSHDSNGTADPGLFGLKVYRPRSPKAPRPKPPREKKVKPPKAPREKKVKKQKSMTLEKLQSFVSILSMPGDGIDRTNSINMVRGGLLSFGVDEGLKLGALRNMLTTYGDTPLSLAEFNSIINLMGLPNSEDHMVNVSSFLEFCYGDAPKEGGPAPVKRIPDASPLPRANTSSSSPSSSDLPKPGDVRKTSSSSSSARQPVIAARMTSSSSSSSARQPIPPAAAALAATGPIAHHRSLSHESMSQRLGYPTNRSAGSYTYTWMESYLSTARDVPVTPGHRAHTVGGIKRPGEDEAKIKRGCCDDEYATNYGGSRHRKHLSTWCSKPKRAVSCDSYATQLLENQRGDHIRKTRINWIDMLEEDWRAYPPEPCQKTGVALYSIIPEVYLPPHQRMRQQTVRDDGNYRYQEAYYRQSYEHTARSHGHQKGAQAANSGIGRSSSRSHKRSARHPPTPMSSSQLPLPRSVSNPPNRRSGSNHRGRDPGHRSPGHRGSRHQSKRTETVPHHSPYETQHHGKASPTEKDHRVTSSGRSQRQAQPLTVNP